MNFRLKYREIKKSNLLKSACLFMFICTFSMVSFAQLLTNVTSLQNTLNESSGLILLNQKLITHNDSGGEAALYEIDSTTGIAIRKVVVSNATNIDWEDICADSTYIYIGDFGNNLGARTNLVIYRVLISDYFNTPNDTVTADAISFNYADQTNFTPTQYTSNFDAEAIISYNDSLYLFTKNWGNYWSNIYAISKIPGTYQIIKNDSINAQGLITGATNNTPSNTIMLTGYTLTTPFIIKLNMFTGTTFSNGNVERHEIQPQNSMQIESITPINDNQYYLTSERTTSTLPFLYRFNTSYLSTTTNLTIPTSFIYPNPTNDFININSRHFSSIEIYNLKGSLIQISNQKHVNISNLTPGFYFVIIKKTNNHSSEIKKLLIT